MVDRYSYPETPRLPAREGKVTYRVSYDYNGGTIIDGKWYRGIIVNEPIIPAGYELVSIAVGLQLNAIPPFATMYLRRKK
jgi:hypothetical protein